MKESMDLKLEDGKLETSNIDLIKEDTGLFSIGYDYMSYKIRLGNLLASKKEFETYEEAKAYVASKPWELILFQTAILIEDYNRIKKEA